MGPGPNFGVKYKYINHFSLYFSGFLHFGCRKFAAAKKNHVHIHNVNSDTKYTVRMVKYAFPFQSVLVRSSNSNSSISRYYLAKGY